jgi:hypothetical protein
MTCFMISPRVVGLPSLPAEERSIADKVKDSVAWEVCAARRGPAVAPQAEETDLEMAPGVEMRDGNASGELVLAGARP